MSPATARRFNAIGLTITLFTVICAILWAFPIYWGIVSSLKPENEVVRPYIELWPETFTLEHYVFALTQTQIGLW
jgi:multiple sugar transport system permease protein